METRSASFQCSAAGMVRHVLSPGRLCKLQAGYSKATGSCATRMIIRRPRRARSAPEAPGADRRRPEIRVVPSSRVFLR
jgi:hypothetical protein